MDVSGIAGAAFAGIQTPEEQFRIAAGATEEENFDSVFQSALNMVTETSDLHNQANEEVIRFTLGQAENTHDLLIAQQKANMALQYTVAVKDGIVDAYKEIMQMQI